jgi:hypothetical protein
LGCFAVAFIALAAAAAAFASSRRCLPIVRLVVLVVNGWKWGLSRGESERVSE